MIDPVITTTDLRAVLFDFDGTLLDSFAAHWEVYQVMFAKFNIRITKDEFIRHFSPDWYHTYQAVGLPRESWAAADAFWLEEATKHEPGLFPGVKDVLLQLRPHYSLGLVTSGTKSRVLRDLGKTALAGHFQVIVTGDDVQRPKPSPEGLERALQTLGARPDQALYVGDTPADYEMSRNASVRFCGVCSPFLRPTDGLAFQVLDSIGDLVELIVKS